MTAPSAVAEAATPFKFGDLVRLVQLRGIVRKADANRLMTVRRVHAPGRHQFLVDDGDPSDPDMRTNGFNLALWVPEVALKPLRREPAVPWDGP